LIRVALQQFVADTVRLVADSGQAALESLAMAAYLIDGRDAVVTGP